MNDIIKIIKSLEDSGVVTETVKHEIKKQERRISWSIVSTFNHLNMATSDFSSSERYKFFSSAPSFKQYRDYTIFQLRA